MSKGKYSFTHIKDKKIMIYKGTIRRDEMACPITTWEPISDKKLWASYRSLSSEEVFEAHKVGVQEEVAFVINWRNDIRPGMQIDYKGRVFEIMRIDDLEGYKKDLKLKCKTSPYRFVDGVLGF